MKITKTCTSCNVEKELSEFSKASDKHIGSVVNYCKECIKAKAKIFYRTKNGHITKIFSGQNRNSKHRKHNPPEYTIKELKQWLMNDWLFDLLYQNWCNCGYSKNISPSLDRIDDSKGYSFDNIQIMTWEENKAKGHRDMRAGKITSTRLPQRKVLKLTRNNEFIEEYVSLSDASRRTGVNLGAICSNCQGKRKTAGGFIWKYK